MNRFANPYQAQTHIGQALQNVAQLIFGQETPLQAEERQAKMDLMRSQQAAYDATASERTADAAKRAQEADGLRRGNEARFNFFPAAVQTVMPDAAGQAENFIRGTPSLAYEGGVQPRPSGLSPDSETYLRRSLHAAPFIAAGGGDAEKLAQAFGLLQDQGFKDQVAAGSMPGSRFLVTQGKTPFDVRDSTLVNLADGILGPTTESGLSDIALKNAKIGTERAHAGYYGASSQAQRALAGKYGAEAENERSGRPGRGSGRGATKMQWVTDANGQAVLMDQADIANNPGLYTPTNATIQNPSLGSPSKVDKAAGAAISGAIGPAVSAALGTEDGVSLPPQVAVQIQALAESFFTDPSSPAFKSPVAAARMAAEQSADALVYTPSTWRTAGEVMLGRGQFIPAPARRVSTPAARTLGAPAPDVAPARPTVPAGALDFYRKNRGTPGVREQFMQKYGFDPEGGA